MGWRIVATFGGEGGGWDFAGTVVRSGEMFLAAGSRDEPAPKVYNDAGEHLWTSTDGRSWDEIPLGPEWEGRHLHSVVAGPAGGFIAFGSQQGEPGSGTTSNGVWQSPDGRTWLEVDTGFDPQLVIGKVVRGARGYLLLFQTFGFEPSLWLSADGLQWEEVHRFTDATHIRGVDEIGAGDEGFVVLGVRVALDGVWERFTFASADGREWFEAPQPFGVEDQQYRPPLVMAALGPDWIAATAQRDDGARIWFSANGLDWASAAVIPDVNSTQAWGPVMVGADGRLFFSPVGAFPFYGPLVVGTPGVWSSTDGRQWAPLDLGDNAVVAGAASGPAGLVLAGATFGQDNESAATFWLGPRD